MKFPKIASDLPKELTILAGILIALGALALVRTVISLTMQGGHNVDFLILMLLAGYGLLRLKPYWRLFTLTISVFVLVFTAMPLIFALLRWSQPYPPGQTVGFQVYFWFVTVMGIGASAWALYVLNKPSIARLFTK
ncbi:hypothetical protein [Ruficoccus sp. ZRK36]|uniref:hypothetical protein n=1 Tax=Ruficoccus sp. ZRK36 TaxID=2866311 RepID=UPI001C736423|nr:hypothetical protein [Ruficoccus sp. ZRK36]QYY37029.1 hypothetical protein K0V07_06000 [Ruficoccus sp. ZRK36]